MLEDYFCDGVYINLTQNSLAEEDMHRVRLRIPTFVFVGSMFCIGVPSNALVLLVYHQQQVSHVLSRRFVVAVSLYDLTECLVGMSFELLDLYFDYKFNVPFACRLVNFTIAVTTCGSMTTILLWSVELFNRVARPLSPQFSGKTQLTGIIVLFVVSLVISIPVLFLFGRKKMKLGNLKGYDCGVRSELKDSKWTLLAVYTFILLGLLVVITMICIQVKVIRIIWLKTVKRKPTLDSIFPDTLLPTPDVVVTSPEVEDFHHVSAGAGQINTRTGMGERPPSDVLNPHQLFEIGSSVDACVGDSVDPSPTTSGFKSRDKDPSMKSSSSRSKSRKVRVDVEVSSPTDRYLSVPGNSDLDSERTSSASTLPSLKRSLSSFFSWNLVNTASASFTSLRERMKPTTFDTSSMSDIGRQGYRVAVLMMLATVVFCLSTVPALVVLVLWATVRDLDNRVRCDEIYFAIYNICMRSYFLSAAANPFLYSYSRPRFWYALLKLFGQDPDKQRRKSLKKTKRKN